MKLFEHIKNKYQETLDEKRQEQIDMAFQEALSEIDSLRGYQKEIKNLNGHTHWKVIEVEKKFCN